ncbi:tripartite tricarboxylate transporter substrate binding protein [Xenophilus arseniciresistens]|uniref:Tripartite tricarboxylate transporter substrate binding protein n=1 Tax=Xenophilus arseniciresistens TaxID=1283306 RepID=A0AAE3SZW9_9BURK|nr:tripartite tricarboxylate transporter substrate binding protein [Xenophilus arseniciresistens]MDA7416945.1 tripartite tricarboxylate transporter substrate binding protein [Xenophilus arseniciresistens]
MKTLRSLALTSLTFLLALQAPAHAQARYPDRPVKVIVALPAGGSVDMVARLLGQKMADQLGQPFVVDNRAGASGQIGVPVVARAAPDGYTLMVSPASFLTTNKSIFKTLPYDPEADFAPVAKLVNQAMVLVVRDKSRYGTVANVLAAAKAAPGKLTYASSGDGSPQHLAGLMFENRAGVRMLHVPYKGGAPAITDLMAGTVDMVFAPIPEALPHIKAGKLHPVGVLGEQRSAILPEVPTMKESGIERLVLSAWIGLLAPARTPQPVLDQLQQAARAALQGEARARLIESGMEPALDDPTPLKQTISQEIRIHAELVKAAGLVPQ